jgi:hypothetical protein
VPALGLALAGVAMAPLSALGGAKLGGDTNAYAMTTWFFAAAAVVGLLDLARGAALRPRRIACAALAGAMTVAAANELRAERRLAFAGAVAFARGWRSNPIEKSVAFARKHPGEVLFVTNPLIGLYADGALYHSLTGLNDRKLAGHEVSDELWRRHLPPRLRFVVVPRRGFFAVARRPPAEFARFTIPYRAHALRNHRVWMAPPDDREGRVKRNRAHRKRVPEAGR